MRKFTLSLLVLLVSVFFINQGVFAQGKYTKTTEVVKSATPYVQPAKTGDNFMADTYSIDFEDEADFTFDFTPWTAVDVDLLPTYGMTGVTWPNAGDPQAFIVFNPATTDPPLTDDPEIQPHSGDKFGACLASVPSGAQGNDDWFISDMVSVGNGASFNFWAKSYTDAYGLERFNVAVSTTTPDPGEFTVISGATYVEAPIVWTEYNYDLSAYAGQDIYVAIQCVTYDAFIFMIDDLVIDPGTTAGPCENFDAINAGGYVAEQLGGYWTTWTGSPGGADDAMVTDLNSNSPTNSFVVDAGAVDLIRQFGDEAIATGMWMYSHYMYVPSGFSGYFNVQSDPTPGVDWNIELYFDDGGTGSFAGQSTETFTYTQDVWFMVEIMYDLDGGMGYVYFDGVQIIEFENTLTIGGIDYYGADSGGDPGAYYDDVCFMEYVPAGPCENFDALAVGDYVAVEVDGWTTWSNNPGSAEDALITDLYSYSPDNSFVVEGSTDLVQLFDDANITTGKYHYSNMIYIPTGYCGYFNLQKDVVPGVEWGFQVQFDVDGTATADAGAAAAGEFSFTFDEWHMNELIVDLDLDMAEYWFDGLMVVSWPWSLGTFGTPGAMTLGGANYYAWSSAGNSPQAYFDDVCFGEYVPMADCEDFDALTPGDYVAGQLGGYWTTWTGSPGGADDALVTDANSNSPSNSFVVDAGAIDLIYQFGDDPIATGQHLYSHYMYVPSGFSGYFNVQAEPTPGVDWNIELYFDDGGTGSFAGQSTETFTYTQDTWFLVEINYDLDAGLAQVWFDGVLIVEFVNTLTIGGIDYYGADSGGDPGAYYDDVCFGEGWIITGIEEPGVATASALIFPNPATEKITIQSTKVIDEVRIYNNMGQMVYSGEFNNSQVMVNTSTFITGMYIVQIKSGNDIEVNKLIIE